MSGRATRIPVGNYPDGRPAIGFGSVWVAMFDDNKVWRIDPDTGRPQEIIPVGHGPWSAAVGSGSVWVTNQCDGTVSRIDPDTNTVVETIETGYNPGGSPPGAISSGLASPSSTTRPSRKSVCSAAASPTAGVTHE